LPKSNCRSLKVVHHGYVEILGCLPGRNHAAFLPNPIGRGFQNKLLNCVALGLPTIAHVSMSPHQTSEPAPGPVIYCQGQADYDAALLSLWSLTQDQREAITSTSGTYLERFFSSTRINRSLGEALN